MYTMKDLLSSFYARLNLLSIVILLILSPSNARTTTERKNDAKSVIEHAFRSSQEGREWIKDENTKNNHWGYARFECNQIYCTHNGYDCWHVSVHVHPELYKRWDRIYLYSYRGNKEFLGEKQWIDPTRWRNHNEDEVPQHLIDYNIVKEENIERPQCHLYCYFYQFTANNEVVINTASRKTTNLRIDPNNFDLPQSIGGIGGYARWNTKLTECGMFATAKAIQIQSTKSNKYLRITPVNMGNANPTDPMAMGEFTVDVAGNGDVNDVGSMFLFAKMGKEGTVTLQSCQFPGHFVCVSGDNKVYVVAAVGLQEPPKECLLRFQSKDNV